MTISNKKKIFVLLFLIVILIINVFSILHKTLTYDETSHYKYGLQILNLNSDRHMDALMPITWLNTIPIIIGKIIVPGLYTNFLYDIRTGRYITILFSLLLGFIVFTWTKKLYGFVPGIISLSLYTLDPNIIAHSQLITTDLYATLMMTLSLYYFWKFLKHGGWKTAFFSAAALGVAQLAKYTCIYLYPIFILILIVKYNKSLIELNTLKKYYKIFLKYFVFFIIVNLIIINIGFLFNRTLTPLKDYQFESNLFKSIQSNSSILKNIPLPFPYPYIQGLDMSYSNEKLGIGCGYIYLLGKLQDKGPYLNGFKGYYFYTFLFKEPITIQILLLITVIFFIINRKKYEFLKNEVFLILPILFFIIYFNFFFKRQIGIRHFIVIYPLLYIWIGSLFKNWNNFSKKIKIAFGTLMIYLIVSVFSYFPHYLSYFNEFVSDRKQAYKILADSNIDWGQDRWYLEQYSKKHPEVTINPKGPVSGKVLVGVNDLVGVFDPFRFKWLRDNFKPTGRVAYSYLIFDVPKESADTLKKMYPPIQNIPTSNINIQK